MTLLLHRRKVAMNEAKGSCSGLAAKGACNLLMDFPLVFFMETEKKSRPEVGKKEFEL